MMDILNFNIGMLGHVDSGKTSLAKALSTVSSTAAFDKNPQSRERGITLDLGFSSFITDIPEHLRKFQYDKLQYTLVDCPGHASLIKTIIGGAQIIDLMVLVVDITKGMQTQTAECLVIGEIVCNKLLVVLNKTDLLPPAKRQTLIEKMKKKILKTLDNTKFANCCVVPVAAKPGGGNEELDIDKATPEGIDTLIQELNRNTYVPVRSADGEFIFNVDHCFSIKGQGTVMTGTVLNGQVNVNDSVEIPTLKSIKKVKSMQMFRKPCQSIKKGDRAGICVTQFDPKSLERGLVCSPGALPLLFAAIVSLQKIRYYTGDVRSKAKFHLSVGHVTTMATVSVFSSSGSGDFNFNQDYLYEEELSSDLSKNQFALLQFETPVICRPDSLAIGSRLDFDVNGNKCRLAFKCQIMVAITEKDYAKTVLPNLKVYKEKRKAGFVERMHDDHHVICKGLLKKESNIEMFTGLKVTLSTEEHGVIDGTFGLSGKIKIRIPEGLNDGTKAQLTVTKGRKGKASAGANNVQSDLPPIQVILRFKRYMYDPEKKMVQS